MVATPDENKKNLFLNVRLLTLHKNKLAAAASVNPEKNVSKLIAIYPKAVNHQTSLMYKPNASFHLSSLHCQDSKWQFSRQWTSKKLQYPNLPIIWLCIVEYPHAGLTGS